MNRTAIERSTIIVRMIASALFLISCILPVFSWAQEKRPVDFRRDLARQKADRYASFSSPPRAQTQNQTDYDVTFYDIDIDLDAATSTIDGMVTMVATVLSDSITSVDVDLASTFTVASVISPPLKLNFTHANDLLTVSLGSHHAYQGETVILTIYYSGPPDYSYGAFGFDDHAGSPMIWSLSEPFGARSWWPCKDVPSDKADSVDIHITVDDNLIAASNGTLVSVVTGSGKKTYNWEERYPIATYLVSVAAHPYTTYSDWYHYSPTDSMEVQFYVFPDHYTSVQATYALTVPMIEVFADLFGEYPFLDEKYGHAEFNWGGGMEHQTITSLGGWSEYLIVHELAHMWWGDMITCDDFHHIWLNEGFATYSEALWSEVTYGAAQYHADMQLAEYFGPGTIYVDDTSDWNRIFHSGLSYNKGSWVLHMLRRVVGDATFFDILKTYYADSRYQYGTVTTEQFRDLCESESGMDLDFFFHQWIYEEYFPFYAYSWSSSELGGNYEIDLQIDQLQTNHIFTMPIDITIETTGGDTTVVVWNNLATQQYSITVTREPTAVYLDKDEWILRTVEEPVLNPTFDRGILLVNGVDFETYGTEIWNAYADSVFWGSYGITFWDCFDETGSGYPGNLPAPIGHGAVPPDTLKQFSTVVWVGNNYRGDITAWSDTPIFSYLAAGGNVALMARLGQDFITEPLRDYLGITWRENSGNTISNCVSTHAGIVNMTPIASQTLCAVFDTTLATLESKLLLKETASFAEHRGLGVWRRPDGGGTHRPDGGQFAFLSGRPYRWNHDHLRSNVEYLLGTLFGEPFDPASAAIDVPALAFRLEQNYPNPFNPVTTIRFALPEKSFVTLRIYDVTGRVVRTLVEKQMDPGIHPIVWNGTNNSGEQVGSSVYFYKIVAGDYVDTRKMVLIR